MRMLEQRVAIITGADSGVGRATARVFAEHGARILVSDRGPDVAERLAEELRGLGAEAVHHGGELSTPDGSRALVEAALTAFGRVDVLVNTATITHSETLLELDPASWRAAVEVLLDSSVFSCQAAARVMQKQQGGRIVNTTGFEGLVGAHGKVSTAAATAAVYGLTRTASVELQRYGITVNAVAPLVRTRGLDPGDADSFTADHVAPVVLFLASDLCGERTGLVVGAAGSRVSTFRVLESQGRTKESRGIWAPEEILEHWDSIAKLRL
jgi:NAD(P)-dependent dehydrogenase (short-subunit alcohol dehydrogenase family)